MTTPLESALNGTSGLTDIRSESPAGLSVITCIFEPKTDLFLARQLATEKIALVRARLPATVHDPQLAPIQAPVGMVIKITLTSDTVSPFDLRDIADWPIRPRLLAVPGISQVIILGGELKEYQVVVSPEKLRAYDVTLDYVMAAAAEANRNAGAGYMVSPSQALVIQGEGRVRTLGDLAQSVVAVKHGVPITIGQLAEVKVGAAFKLGDAAIDGKPCVFLTVMKLPWANTLNVTAEADRALEEIQAGLPTGVVMNSHLFRQADFINVAIGNVNRAMIEGALLVTLVLSLFLFSWRSALISLAAIPLSLVAAILVLTQSGRTLNIMTLGGLAIAIGEVVDDAIIDVENVYRRLRENLSSAEPKSPLAIVYHASSEVRGSVVFASLVVALVFLPILKLTGLEGAIFAPLGVAYIVAILASLVVALTVTPALCYILLPAVSGHRQESWTVRTLKRAYRPLLDWALGHPSLVGGASMLMVTGILATIPYLGGEFIASVQGRGYYVVFGGEFAAQQAAARQLLLLGTTALLGVVLLLYVALRSPRLVALVLVNLPLALIGGIVAILMTGGTHSVASLIGLIALFGITMRNSIMLISHYRHLMVEEGVPFGPSLASRGAMERLSPILMTALAAGLGLLPIATSVGEPGRELQQPMAVVILGGLVSSTILNLLVIPSLFLRFGRGAEQAFVDEAGLRGLGAVRSGTS